MSRNNNRDLMLFLIQNRIVQHILFWIFSIYVLFRLFNINEQLIQTDLIYTLLFHISLSALVYTNLLILIPYLFQKNKYYLFLGASILLLLAASFLNQLTFTQLADWIFPGYYFISYYEWWDIIQFMAAYWAISTVLKLSKSWFEINEKEKEIRLLLQEKTAAELQALKAQLNPHFLFNSLNNIYSLALYEHKKTPKALLQLSDCLRYVLYDCTVPSIELSKEIKLIENFIELQELSNEVLPQASFKWEGNPEELNISPLLFLPLVENAYKHAKPNEEGQKHIDIQLSISDKKVNFTISNHKRKEQIKRKVGGVGLENLKKRLDLLYPLKHQIHIEDREDYFKAILNLDLA